MQQVSRAENQHVSRFKKKENNMQQVLQGKI